MSDPDETIPEPARQAWLTISAEALIGAAKTVSSLMPGLSFLDLIPAFRKQRKQTIQEITTALVTKLTAAGVDPVIFDTLVSNEINRRMKVQFGITFLVFTFVFTASSYAIVVLDGIYKWGISPVAITALIIETPIQFVGLLYIIARNLFPTVESVYPAPLKSRAKFSRATALP